MCPRCHGPSKNKANPSGRCAKCLSKLRRNKKDPNRWEHANKLADDALRRQKGDTPTTTAKKSGNADRHQIIQEVKEGYRKYGKGRVLSPDRKNNAKGYEKSNVEMVPKELNRGRHHVNKKKLAVWRHHLHKSGLTIDEFSTILLAKAEASGIGSFDIDLMKATILCDSDALVNLLVDSEDSQAEELISFVQKLTDDQISDIFT